MISVKKKKQNNRPELNNDRHISKSNVVKFNEIINKIDGD